MQAVVERAFLPGDVYSLVAALTPLLATFGFRINRMLPVDGSENMQAPLPLAEYTLGTLPDAADWTGGIVYVSDAPDGQHFQGAINSEWVVLSFSTPPVAGTLIASGGVTKQITSPITLSKLGGVRAGYSNLPLIAAYR